MDLFTPPQIAKYFLKRSIVDGDLVSPLKMQKLIYYAYVWTLVSTRQKLFEEPIEAWPVGPVIPSLYRDLKIYGSQPIKEEFIGDPAEIDKAFHQLPDEIQQILDGVYEEYMSLTAFELVMSTHDERPWKNARVGLGVRDPSSRPIDDNDIEIEYSTRAK